MAVVSKPAPAPSIKKRSPHGPRAIPASKVTRRADSQARINCVTGMSAMPSVFEILLAVPIGNTAIGTSRPIRRRATLVTVPSPPAMATTSAGRLSAFSQPSSFAD